MVVSSNLELNFFTFLAFRHETPVTLRVGSIPSVSLKPVKFLAFSPIITIIAFSNSHVLSIAVFDISNDVCIVI